MHPGPRDVRWRQFIQLRAIRRDSASVAFLNREGRVISSGPFRDGVMSVRVRGGTYDFARLPDTAYTDFYPRGRPRATYTYAQAAMEFHLEGLRAHGEVLPESNSYATIVGVAA